jgi:hypothetical protein
MYCNQKYNAIIVAIVIVEVTWGTPRDSTESDIPVYASTVQMVLGQSVI